MVWSYRDAPAYSFKAIGPNPRGGTLYEIQRPFPIHGFRDPRFSHGDSIMDPEGICWVFGRCGRCGTDVWAVSFFTTPMLCANCAEMPSMVRY